MLAGGEADLAFGLGDLEAGDAEAEGVQDVGIDLIIGSPCLGSGEVGVLQVEGSSDSPYSSSISFDKLFPVRFLYLSIIS